jgi:hypothetical protein
MKLCDKGCHPICDFCAHYNFNPDSEGVYIDKGYCSLKNKQIDPDGVCDEFYCRNAEGAGKIREASEALNRTTFAYQFKYKNWKGKVSSRTVIPIEVWHGTTKYHTEPQWFLKAMDLDKQAERDFALKDIIKRRG